LRRTMKQKLIGCKDGAAKEIERLLARMEELRALIIMVDGILEGEKPLEDDPRAHLRASRGSGRINDLLLAACVDWKTINELMEVVPELQGRHPAGISTRCRLLWLGGLLERRSAVPCPPGRYPRKGRAGYTYKTLKTALRE